MSARSLKDRLSSASAGTRLILVPRAPVQSFSLRPIGAAAAAAIRGAAEEARPFGEIVSSPLADFERIGLKNASRIADRDLAREIQRSAGLYEKLSMAGAVAVRVNGEVNVERLVDAANDRFRVLLDVRADSEPGIRAQNRQKSFKANAYPKEANIERAAADQVDGTGVLVGVLDTGIDADHREFRKRPVEFRYVPPAAIDDREAVRDVRGFDTDGHGTHVCGTIIGRRAGLVPNANLNVAAVIESESFRASLWRTAYGLDWLLRKFALDQYRYVPSVVNLSLCFYADWLSTEDVADWVFFLEMAIANLEEKDALIVAAAGNRGQGHTGLPASFDNVLAVGAVDMQMDVANFSGLPTPTARRDIYGFGVDILSSFERDRDGFSYYQRLHGTSMAAPYVASIATMLRQTNPGASARDVRDHLLETAIERPGGIRIARFQHWGRTT